MRLVDIIELDTGGSSTRVAGGDRKSARDCAVNMSLLDVCDNEQESVLVAGEPGLYSVRPIGIVASLKRPAGCVESDDSTWLEQAVRANLDLPIGRALVSAPPANTMWADAVWIGHPDVHQINYTRVQGTPPTNLDDLANAIADGRTYWATHVISPNNSTPLFHASPKLAMKLKAAGILEMSNGEAKTVWGDDVILSPGYDVRYPITFWTGAMKAVLLPVQSTGNQFMTRSNYSTNTASTAVMLDVAPCTIVRIGNL